ncbi:Hypothetical protein FKW44_022618 [Caligus rogercresseyi]|uniref:Uncharacterized protein n=1 Tax=Caligus rogercresseyi TaxID=217165 RepID=A0A7T8JTN1_CALRO|nr:Hypothetical protein FKW44_022618 [Caligus rogercresseyi]
MNRDFFDSSSTTTFLHIAETYQFALTSGTLPHTTQRSPSAWNTLMFLREMHI